MRPYLTSTVVASIIIGLASTAIAADHDKRGYVSGNFGFALDATKSGWVQPVESAKPATQQAKPGIAAPQASPGLTPMQPGALPALPRPANSQPGVPDLVIDQIMPAADATRAAVITVRNAGSGHTVPTNIKVGCSAFDGSSTCQVGQSAAANLVVLPPGSRATVTVPVTALAKGGGVLRGATVRACADGSNGVRESNEANNCRDGRW